MSLYEDYRPKSFDEVYGQAAAIAELTKYVKTDSIPQVILFHGATGIGKTTLAYILTEHLGGWPKVDLRDINCGIVNPMETIQGIGDLVNHPSGPLTCQRMVWVLDEFQSFSRSTFAQQGCLKMLEKPPKWAYFFLCTTDPSKILETIRGRCVQIKLKPLTADDQRSSLLRVMTKAKIKVSPKVVTAIVNYAGPNARKAIVALEKVIGLGEADAIASLEVLDESTTIDLCRALVKPGCRWRDINKIVASLDEQKIESEEIRRSVLNYCKACMLTNGPVSGQAARIVSFLRDHTYDSGMAGLCGMIYEATGK